MADKILHINTDGMRRDARSIKYGQGTQLGGTAKMLIDCCDYADQLEAENEKLKKFAREIIKDYCWNHGDPDGGDVQDLAENLGLIKSRIATEKDVDPEWDDYEVGDTIFVFSDILKGNNNG